MPSFLIVVLPLAICTLTNAQCEIDPIGTTETIPLILGPNSKELIYPTRVKNKKIHLDEKEKVDVACPGGKIILGKESRDKNVLSAQCVSGEEFEIEEKRYEWKQISCNEKPKSTAKETGHKCGDKKNQKEIEIGYDISSDRFVRLMLICFDEKLQSTLHSYFDIIPTINQGAKGVERPFWIQSDFFRIPMDLLYKRLNQRKTINGLLGLPDDDKTYIQDNDYFLSRGHLTAKSDMFYASSQDSTFRFLNALPQWQTVNGANWNQVEQDVRDYAENHNVHLSVWTGGYGVTDLPHAEDEKKMIPLYLYASKDEQLVPVPDVFWKVVYDAKNERGVALISSNNPYKKKVNKFCKDISDSLTWLSWKKDDQKKGISWACTISTFNETLKALPELSVIDILR